MPVIQTKKRPTNNRSLIRQCLNVCTMLISVLMIWKGLLGWTASSSPMIIDYFGVMDPAFHRGDVLFLDNNKPTIDIGDIVAFTVKDRSIPLIRRVVEIHRLQSDQSSLYLTKGDSNVVSDRGLYAKGQFWIERRDIIGVVRVVVPHASFATILMNDYPVLKAVAIAIIAIRAFRRRP
ncbi:Aste57867_872 [Aphanomyces stellatus]|uniref:Signal peptidase complex catalytic subunit SEC11 n=1 Tax=Aphanomyces stellatus TaxID=120398 RepID=A0A485K8T4_9STRA|nr:hypothetical protein As57867_000871 [Aphanomyces stellatus]VFT78096.1 Aste57867_872 [Aphanomyces stellatus]